jgi:hypothetical protein
VRLGVVALVLAALAAGQGSAAARLPYDVCAVTVSRGDFDGDGRRDSLYVYREVRGRNCDTFRAPPRVSILLGNGRAVLRRAIAGPIDAKSLSPCEPCAAGRALDLDGDGRDELVIGLGHGASDQWVGLFRLTPRGLRRVGLRGRPGFFTLTTAGSLAHDGAVGCRRLRSGGIELRQISGSLESRARVAYAVDRYRYDGHSLRLVGSSRGVLPEDRYLALKQRARRSPCGRVDAAVRIDEPRALLAALARPG